MGWGGPHPRRSPAFSNRPPAVQSSLAASAPTMPSVARTLRGAAPFAVLLAAWAIVTRAGFVSPLFLPPPADVPRVAWEQALDGSLWINLAASLGRVLLGVVVSVPLAVALGVVVGLNRRLAPVVEPIVGFFNALSGIAGLPLAITWFGLGWASVTFIMFNTIFLPGLLQHAGRCPHGAAHLRAGGAHDGRLPPARCFTSADPGGDAQHRHRAPPGHRLRLARADRRRDDRHLDRAGLPPVPAGRRRAGGRLGD